MMSKASSALPPKRWGWARGSMMSRNSTTDPGQPWEMSRGSGRGTAAPFMDVVDVDAVHRHLEMGEAVELFFLHPPIELVQPIGAELPHVVEVATVGPASVGPASRARRRRRPWRECPRAPRRAPGCERVSGEIMSIPAHLRGPPLPHASFGVPGRCRGPRSRILDRLPRLCYTCGDRPEGCRRTGWLGGIPFQEVSLGYPNQWDPERGIGAYLHEVTPALP